MLYVAFFLSGRVFNYIAMPSIVILNVAMLSVIIKVHNKPLALVCRKLFRTSVYNLTGVLIHIGDEAHQGHYKAHIQVEL